MNQHLLIADVLARQEARREERRRFLKAAGATSAAIAGSSLLAACGGDDNGSPGNVIAPPSANPDPSDADILNFALNLEYLEASFYAYATTGSGLDQSLIGGTGTQGQVTAGRAVSFTDPLVRRYANEIAKDEREHVAFLRSAGALGSSAVAMPALDLGVGPNNAFSVAARAAGIITGANDVFDPYASDNNFLLAAFLFEDVGVTAYKGAASLIDKPAYLSAAAGILAAEAYHAGLIRTTLYRKGVEQIAAKVTPTVIDLAGKISDARDTLDGAGEDDQGIAATTTGTAPNTVTTANLVPTDGNAIVYSRSAGQVLNIVYLSATASVTKGGFFPNGVNGAINAGTGTTPA